jgi:hypothetical protein
MDELTDGHKRHHHNPYKNKVIAFLTDLIIYYKYQILYSIFAYTFLRSFGRTTTTVPIETKTEIK